MDRRTRIGLAVGGVLVALAGGLTGLRLAQDRDTFSLTAEPFQTGSPSPLPTPSETPAAPSPTPSPHSAATPSATPSASATAAPTMRPTATTPTSAAPSTGTPYRARALPANCLSYGHACAYPDATHAVPGGVEDLRCTLTGANAVRLTWRSVNLSGPARVEEFVVRLWRQPPGWRGQDMNGPGLYQFRVGRDTFAATVGNLQPGETYSCFVQELNVAGLSPAMGVVDVRIPGDPTAPTPTQSATPTPSATPTATPEPTETP